MWLNVSKHGAILGVKCNVFFPTSQNISNFTVQHKEKLLYHNGF